ncbi:MAG: 16S rRNA (cytidine(1402)-2'-O)-methyltransferase [Desulfovibrionaceae bacterium]|nr:16S rRNA (cytidine(1402)-2'-O)-methyltransferase [Desulfovibrionaceae bacterium]
MERGHLWLVATPLGNLGDFSERARAVLSSADCILAEDTRRTLQLLRLAGLQHSQVISFHDHNEEDKLSQVFSLLQEGKTVALVSDAGTPLIADPGYRLVRACRKMGFPVSIVPGPSAPLAALAISGIPPIPFTFLGFLPRSESDLRKLFAPYASLVTTLVFFERADRLRTSLGLASEILGPREVAVCRELTKTHEEVLSLSLSAIGELPLLLGEITVVIGPPVTRERTERAKVIAALADALAKGAPARQIVKEVRESVVGWGSKELYALLETQKRGPLGGSGYGEEKR